MKVCIYICFMLLVLGLASWCSAESDSLSEKTTNPQKLPCGSVDKAVKIDDVLVGTDVVSFTDFEPAKSLVAGNYRIEMGGAVSKLNVVHQGHAWQISRRFSEPGFSSLEKSYWLTCVNNQEFQGPGIIGVVTDNGLLVLEEHSGVNSIPSDLWIFYIDNR